MSIRLRYAPSPTGYLHIGNTRTALMNFLFAKHYNGTFIVRIEDTDTARNVDGAIESQFENLRWLNINDDESIFKNSNEKKYGEYIQSRKTDRYLKISEKLISKNFAYRCFCTSEELEEDYKLQEKKGIVSTRYSGKCKNLTLNEINEKLQNNLQYSIRFSVPKDKTWVLNDLVRNDITFESKDIGDFVIIKSNKIPTYNFAVVIDDHDMEISHVFRGEEHISNTPKQLMIYDALNWNYPKFGHLTLIIDSTGKKLSKRSGNALFFIEEYKKLGYLPEGIFNYISLLGWSSSDNKEIMNINELIQKFDEKRFSKAPSTFDIVKMKWINHQHMKKISEDYYLEFVKKFINKDIFNLEIYSEDKLNEIILLFKTELEFASQINNHLDIFFDYKITDRQIKTFKEQINSLISNKDIINYFLEEIKNSETWSIDNIKKIITECSKKFEINGKNLFMPLRIIATLKEHGPSLANVIYLIGKEKVITNINNFL